ncbi:MAG: hypothetical protein J6Y34_03700, partial [Bacteroidales bacterium]|nr:hypothetical protein [Bacteroidales bacterium]
TKALKKVAGGNAYDWKFVNVGGTTRVSIQSGADIAHLGELDQKMWTVLSCPVKGLEIDERTLQLMDSDADGKIRANEVVETAEWLTSVLNNPDDLLKQEDSLPLSAIKQENEEGAKLFDSAKHILANLGKEGDAISVADTADRLAIFAKTRFNGDGVITEQTCEEEALKNLVAACMKAEGSTEDRSGEQGVNAEQLENFFTHCREYADWKALAAEGSPILPYGDRTAEAFAAYESVRDKIDDYFLRCRFTAFHEDAAETLDVPAARLEGIAEKNLTACLDEISSYPLARVRKEAVLPLAEGLNPAWEKAVSTLNATVFPTEFPGKDALSEADWQAVRSRFAPYAEWLSNKKGAEVEPLEPEIIQSALEPANQKALLDLMEQDKALEAEALEIQNVDKLLHCYRDFYRLLKNYITFVDFYDRTEDLKAVFQAGTLYIDQRSCDLCLKVSDMPKHMQSAGLSGMFLMYCECRSKVKNETMTIVAAMTDGDVNDLREGKNAVFYDRNGLDWDATIIKIMDNPISVRQAFWSPYRKFGKFVNEQISKFASDKESKVTSDMSSGVSDAGTKLAEQSANADATAAASENKPKSAFDVGKFLGLFAVIGMALGTICGFLLDLLKSFFGLKWWMMLVVIAGLMIVISGPSMLLAWLKLRKRDLAPVLNANGWAINARVLVNIVFGSTLTHIASFPMVADPMAGKKMPWWKKLFWLLLVLAVVFGVLYFTNTLARFGLKFR